MDVGAGCTLAGAAHTQPRVSFTDTNQGSSYDEPTYYQFYFSKSSHAEVKLKHTLEISPELQTIYKPTSIPTQENL